MKDLVEELDEEQFTDIITKNSNHLRRQEHWTKKRVKCSGFVEIRLTSLTGCLNWMKLRKDAICSANIDGRKLKYRLPGTFGYT